MIREQDMGPENVKMRDEENRVRNLFINDPSNEEIRHPFCHLIDVFNEKDTFQFCSSGNFRASNMNSHIRTSNANSDGRLPKSIFRNWL
jgi:hypothetical protein